MERPDKARRKELLRQFREAERAQTRATASKLLRLTPEQLDDLHDYLEVCIGDGCDRTLRFTVAWAKARRKSAQRLLDGLEEFGGYCDCEVVGNVTRDRLGWPERP